MGEFIYKYKKHILNNILLDNDFSFFLNYNKHSWDNLEPNKKKNAEVNFVEDIDFRRKKLVFEVENFKNIIFSSKPFCHEDDIEFLINKNYKYVWGYLSLNTNQRVWSEFFLEKYMDKLSWFQLSRNSSIFWTKELIEKFNDKLQFFWLSENYNIEMDLEIFNLFEKKWNLKFLCKNPSIAKDPKLESVILNHDDAHWYSPNIYYYNFPKSDFIFDYGGICTNSGINWSLDKFNKYKENIDFWLIARFGNVAFDVIQEYGDLLDENRDGGYKSIKDNERYFSVKLFYNGWENLLLNKNTVVTSSLIKYLSNKKTTIYKNFENNGKGTFNIKTKDNIITLLKDIDCSNVDINYRDFTKLDFRNTIDKLIIDDSIFPNWVYEKILKPYLINEKDNSTYNFERIIK